MAKRRTAPIAPSTPAALPPDRLQQAGAWGVAACALLLPFLGLPGLSDTMEPMFDSTARRLAILVFGGVLLALALVGWGLRRRVTWRWHPLDGLVALFTVALAVAASASPYPRLAWAGPLWCQVALPFTLLGVLLYAATRALVRTPAEVARVVGALVLAGTLVALHGLVEWASPHGATAAVGGTRLAGLLGNPMFTGLYLAMLLPAALGASLASPARGWRVTWLACAGLLGVALLLTLTRGAWLGGAVALLLLGGACLWRFRQRLSRPVLLGLLGAVVVLGGAISLTPALRTRLASMSDRRGGALTSRLVYWQSAWRMCRARPVLGWGPGTFSLIAPEFRDATNIKEGGVSINRVAYLALPHNLPLQLAAESGVTGALAYLLLALTALCAGLWVRRAPPERWGLAWGLVGLVAAHTVTNLFAFDVSLTLSTAWLGLALLATVCHEPRPVDLPRLPGFGRALCIILGAIVLLGTVGWSCQEYAAAHETRLGTRQAFTEARAWAKRGDLTRCREASDAGIARLQGVVDATPVPSVVSVRYLALAYRERMLLLRARDPAAGAQARAALFREGTRALALMDRDPEMLLFLAIEYLDANRFEDARGLLTQVLVYLPNSAQAHLLQAKLLAFDRRLPAAQQAAEYALTLDPEYARAHLWLARIHAIQVDRILLGQEPGRDAVALVTGRDAQGRQFAQAACTHFAQAETLGHRLDDSDRMKYASLCALREDRATALAAGRPIQDPTQRRILTERIRYFSYVRGQIGEGERLIAQMLQSVPRPATPAQVTSEPDEPRVMLPWER